MLSTDSRKPLAAEGSTNADAEVVLDELQQRRGRHHFMLGLSLFIIAASFLLRFNDGNSVRLPWLDFALPPLCGSRSLFDVECPGCGLTRSFITLAAGDLQRSFHHHRLGWLMALAVVMQIPYRWIALRELRLGIIVERSWPTWFGNALIVLLIVNWLLRAAGWH